MSLTRKSIIEILKNHETIELDELAEDTLAKYIQPENYEKIADNIMTEIIKTIKPKKECLSDLSRDGKHHPIISDDGVYCGICGLDMDINE